MDQSAAQNVQKLGQRPPERHRLSFGRPRPIRRRHYDMEASGVARARQEKAQVVLLCWRQCFFIACLCKLALKSLLTIFMHFSLLQVHQEPQDAYEEARKFDNGIQLLAKHRKDNTSEYWYVTCIPCACVYEDLQYMYSPCCMLSVCQTIVKYMYRCTCIYMYTIWLVFMFIHDQYNVQLR